MLYETARKELSEIVKKMFSRYETNTAGGNVSVRMNDEHIIMTPRHMAKKYHCDISPHQILVVDMAKNIVEGYGEITREINMHMACYKQNKEIGCVLHGHALYSMVFATMGMNMPNLTESTQKFGEIPCLDYAPATSFDLAENVRTYLKKHNKISNAILLNKHGVLVTDRDLSNAYDNLVRLEYNAYIAERVLILEKLGIGKTDNNNYKFNIDE